MPLTPVSVAAIMQPSLTAVSFIGVGTPKLAQALGIGLTTWTPKIAVQTVDSGTLGAGKGVPIPIILAPPVLQLNLTLGFTANGILGLLAPVFITGLTTGLVQTYATALTNTAHVGVGLGAGVATFRPPPAFADLKRGFDAVGATGDGAVKLCRSLAQGLESTFSTLVLPQPISGPPSPAPGAGSGFGVIL
jgi:hypothetical protein